MGKGQSLRKIKRNRAQKKGALREEKRRIAEKEITDGVSASSSFPSILTSGGSDQYDVFLSFRGSDTRNGFTDHLYRSLISVGTKPISVFRDDNSLAIGKDFNSEILDAITRSKILIPIISENYALSKWCLRELVCIMDYRKSMSHIVLPIFYKVLPSDVWHLNGNFGEAFRLRKKRFDKEDIQEGQRALTEVSNLNGWESEKFAKGNNKYAVYMWEDCKLFPYLGIEELKLRCSVKIRDCGEFRMHDQLRDLGRSIFCQGQPPEKCLKPWLNMQTEQSICICLN